MTAPFSLQRPKIYFAINQPVDILQDAASPGISHLLPSMKILVS